MLPLEYRRILTFYYLWKFNESLGNMVAHQRSEAMIYFVGDKPSKCSIDPSTSFVGTNAHLTVLTWIHRMNLSLNDIMLFNFDSFVNQIKTKKLVINEDDQIVALGKEASELLHDAVLPHFRIPHPSGLTRNLNNPIIVNGFLKECKAYVLQR